MHIHSTQSKIQPIISFCLLPENCSSYKPDSFPGHSRHLLLPTSWCYSHVPKPPICQRSWFFTIQYVVSPCQWFTAHLPCVPILHHQICCVPLPICQGSWFFTTTSKLLPRWWVSEIMFLRDSIGDRSCMRVSCASYCVWSYVLSSKGLVASRSLLKYLVEPACQCFSWWDKGFGLFWRCFRLGKTALFSVI